MYKPVGGVAEDFGGEELGWVPLSLARRSAVLALTLSRIMQALAEG